MDLVENAVIDECVRVCTCVMKNGDTEQKREL